MVPKRGVDHPSMADKPDGGLLTTEEERIDLYEQSFWYKGQAAKNGRKEPPTAQEYVPTLSSLARFRHDDTISFFNIPRIRHSRDGSNVSWLTVRQARLRTLFKVPLYQHA